MCALATSLFLEGRFAVSQKLQGTGGYEETETISELGPVPIPVIRRPRRRRPPPDPPSGNEVEKETCEGWEKPRIEVYRRKKLPR